MQNDRMFKNVGEKKFRRWSLYAVAILALVTLAFLSQYPKIRLDYDFEKFFPVEDAETDFFFDFRDKFESDNDFVLIAIQNETGVFNWEFLEKVRMLQTKIDSLPHVQFTRSIVSEKETLVYPGGFMSNRPFIQFENKDLQRDKSMLLKNKELVRTLIADDLKSLCLFVRHDDFLIAGASDSLTKSLRKLTDSYSFDKVRIAGRTVGQTFYIEKMSREMVLFVCLSFGLIVLFLLIAFRSGWGLILPLIIIVGTLVWVIGFIGGYGEPVSVVMTTLPSILFVVAMSDVIHLLSRYLDAFRTGIGKLAAIKLAIREVGMATFLTSLTTAIGFFSLYFVSVQPLQVFGVITGFGVLIAFALTVVLLPILVFYFPDPKYIRSSSEDPFWKKRLSRWFLWVLRKRRRVMILSSLVVLLSLWGTSRIEVNNFLMDELSEEEPMKQDFRYLDDHFGGVRPFELAVFTEKKDATLWDLDLLNEIEKVENYVENEYGVVVKLSLVKAIKVINRSMHGGDSSYYILPKSQKELNRMRRPLRLASQGKIYHLMVDSTEQVGRISGAIPDWGSQKVMIKNKELLDFLEQDMKISGLRFQLTGTAHLFDKNISYLSTSMVKGLSISILIVAAIMGLLYRSLKMVVISIVPNILPLFVIAGIMGFAGVELKTSTAIIFTIAFGIAVDDTIHFLGKFKYELMKGRSMLYALKRSYLTTGKAMILTSLILCAGFLLLITSSFLGTFWMGILLCITLLVALIADLTLLPALIYLFYKPKRKL